MRRSTSSTARPASPCRASAASASSPANSIRVMALRWTPRATSMSQKTAAGGCTSSRSCSETRGGNEEARENEREAVLAESAALPVTRGEWKCRMTSGASDSGQKRESLLVLFDQRGRTYGHSRPLAIPSAGTASKHHSRSGHGPDYRAEHAARDACWHSSCVGCGYRCFCSYSGSGNRDLSNRRCFGVCVLTTQVGRRALSNTASIAV